MKRLLVLFGVGLSSLCLVAPAGAEFIPYGILNDVPLNTVLNDWGWTIAYRGDYGAYVPIDEVFANATGSYVMLAGIQDGSDTIDVLAAALTAEVRTYTPWNTPHTANGAQWYYNGDSMGFAGLGDTIYQTSADAHDVFNLGVPERDRLSWHTDYSSDAPPVELEGGWRSGTNIWLNDSTDWDRLVLTNDGGLIAGGPAAPLPAAGLLGVIGLAVAGWRLRKQETR